MFAVIYKWKIKPGMESQFASSWEVMTIEFRDVHGGLGSCLHRDDSGHFIAYAKWPNRQPWEKNKNFVNIDSLKEMKDCIEQSFPAIPLEINKDLLVKQ
jgi:heme-degrading monooxygenase HmoA